MSKTRFTKKGSFVCYSNDKNEIMRRIRQLIGSGEYDIEYNKTTPNLVVYQAVSK